MITKEQKSKIGKKSKRDGAKFELLVRKDLESKGWTVSKWMNNVEFSDLDRLQNDVEELSKEFTRQGGINIPQEIKHGKLISAKHKFCGIGRPMSLGNGFPDFIAFKEVNFPNQLNILNIKLLNIKLTGKVYNIMAIEVKSNGYLDKIEKEKCVWLLENNIFSHILIASLDYPEENINLPPSKRKKKEIKYVEFKN